MPLPILKIIEIVIGLETLSSEQLSNLVENYYDYKRIRKGSALQREIEELASAHPELFDVTRQGKSVYIRIKSEGRSGGENGIL